MKKEKKNEGKGKKELSNDDGNKKASSLELIEPGKVYERHFV